MKYVKTGLSGKCHVMTLVNFFILAGLGEGVRLGLVGGRQEVKGEKV